ncbi:hypothetical protein AHF37_06044 [Paragonimus kellicotti]|nr:hypothetical protein AHF37_06044 [Paragonimus kellicotti]
MLEQLGSHLYHCALNHSTAFGFLFVIALLTVLYCYNNVWQIRESGNVRYVKPVENLLCQSKVIDSKNHIRASTWKFNDTLFKDIKTVHELTEYVVKKYSSIPCFGMRPNFESSPTWITYEEMGKTVEAIGSVISQWFDSPQGEHFVGLYGRNSAEWFSTELACGSYGMIAVPLYDTLGQEALVHILKQTGLHIVLCDTVARTRQLLNLIQDQLTHIIIVNKDDPDWESLKESTKGSIELITFDQLVTIGQKNPLPANSIMPHRISTSIQANVYSSPQHRLRLVSSTTCKHPRCCATTPPDLIIDHEINPAYGAFGFEVGTTPYGQFIVNTSTVFGPTVAQAN